MAAPQITLLTAAMLLGSGLFAAGAVRAGEKPVTVDLRVRLVDAQQAPLAGMPLRLRIGSAIEQQESGVAATTDASGMVPATVRVGLTRRTRAMPTNFAGSIFARAQKTQHLQVGIELAPFPGGAESPWLWTVDIDRFADGAVLASDEFNVWTVQSDGRFAMPLRWLGPTEGAVLPDGRRLAALPWRPAELKFEPLDAEARRWSLSLVVMRRP